MTEEIYACFFCGAHCTKEDYCYGCGAYICDECSEKRPSPWGRHNPEDHELEEEEEE